MASISFYARGDGSTAGNANLNVENLNSQPVIQITFDSGTSGDLRLDQIANPAYVPGGSEPQYLPDPDTTMFIGGVEYDFTVELVGTLPVDGKVPDPLEGKKVAIISYIDSSGQYQRLFFVTDGSGTQTLMGQFGQGAITLLNSDLTPDPFYPCFCAGTEIATPSGNRKVETLVAGDFVLNDRGEAKQLLWVGRSEIPAAELRAHPDLRPIRITAGAIAPSCPSADLDVSPQHRIVLEGPKAELLFGEERVLATARHLVGALAEVVTADADVTYYHLLLEDHEILVSNGLATESFQPARRMIEAMTGENRELLEKTLQALGMTEMLSRKDALRALKAGEAMLLAKAIRDGAAPEGTALGTSSGTLAAVA